MSKIKNIIAREIKDSRANPTVEVELETEKGNYIASCPSGASTGKNEAMALPAEAAIKNISEIIAPKLKGKDVLNQKEIDGLMIVLDGTENKSKLGANAILSVSVAVCRAGAASKKISLYRHITELAGYQLQTANYKLPLAMFNLLEGGVHTNKKTGMACQEFMVMPQKDSFAENLIACNKIFNNLKDILKNPEMGFEGGFESPFEKTEQALYSVKSAIDGEKATLTLDFAASEFFDDGKYNIEGRELTRAEMLEFYEDLTKKFPITSIEDPFDEEDWNGFEDIVRQLGQKILIIGDDLTTTNINKIKEAHSKKACNGVILKLNQIGTVSETIEVSNLAKSFGWKTIVSHRSGETMDDFIADFAVGTGADFIKAGSPAKEERMVKYNRLLKIEQELKHG